jgi:hypothetical protein
VMIRALALTAAGVLFAGEGLGQQKQPLTFEGFLDELVRIDREAKAAYKDRNALKVKELHEARQRLAARVKGAEVTADLTYGGNKLVKRKAGGKAWVQVAQLQYGLSWTKEPLIVTGRLTDAGEAQILRALASTGKPGDRVEIKGTVGLAAVSGSPKNPTAVVTVILILKSFEAKKKD